MNIHPVGSPARPVREQIPPDVMIARHKKLAAFRAANLAVQAIHPPLGAHPISNLSNENNINMDNFHIGQ